MRTAIDSGCYMVEVTWIIYSTDKACMLPLVVGLLLQLKAGNQNVLAELKKIRNAFSVDSNGVFSGCIGAMNDLAVRIMSRVGVGVDDSGTYLCLGNMKHFYALHTQDNYDKMKRFLWISPGRHSASHDSAA